MRIDHARKKNRSCRMRLISCLSRQSTTSPHGSISHHLYDRPFKGAKAAEPDWTQKESPAAFQEALVVPASRLVGTVRRPCRSTVKNAPWCHTPIDRFVLAKMESSGVAPNPPPSKRQLIRRLYFDLMGLHRSPRRLPV